MNKKLLALFAGCAVAGLVIAAGVGITSRSNRVAVLDVDRVKLEALVYEKVRIETEKYVSALKARFANDEKALQTKAAELKKKIDASGNKQNEYAKEIQQLNNELAEFQRKVRFQSALIAKARQAALAQIDPVAQAALKELSQKKGLKIILPRPYVTYFAPCADVTADFITLLNDKDLAVTFPDPAQFTVPAVVEQGTTQEPAQPKK